MHKTTYIIIITLYISRGTMPLRKHAADRFIQCLLLNVYPVAQPAGSCRPQQLCPHKSSQKHTGAVQRSQGTGGKFTPMGPTLFS